MCSTSVMPMIANGSDGAVHTFVEEGAVFEGAGEVEKGCGYVL